MNRIIRKLFLGIFGCLLFLPSLGQESWNRYPYFGLADAWNRKPTVDVSTLPPIKGLKYRSVYVLCPKDTCFALRAVMAIRCPQEPMLLEWASSRAARLVDWCKTGQFDCCPVGAALKVASSADICNQYIRLIGQAFRQGCRDEGDHNVPNEQYGFLLADCWQTERYCTFYESTWYDMLSCGNKRRESYYSVDLASGKALQLFDLVKEDRWPELADLLTEYLRNEAGEPWLSESSHHSIEPLALLKVASGCALLKEGLNIYYHPYTISSGADGEFMAIIPYALLDGILSY